MPKEYKGDQKFIGQPPKSRPPSKEEKEISSQKQKTELEAFEEIFVEKVISKLKENPSFLTRRHEHGIFLRMFYADVNEEFVQIGMDGTIRRPYEVKMSDRQKARIEELLKTVDYNDRLETLKVILNRM